MIYDRNDNLECYNYVEYNPILTGPHPQTPTPTDNQAPTANAGPDQVVGGNSATLDASQSYDTDGTIAEYHWNLEHAEEAAYNRNVSGKKVTVKDLQKGFYAVYLTVIDNDGAVDTDDMVLAVAAQRPKVAVVPLF